MVVKDLNRSGELIVKHVGPHVRLNLLEVVERGRELVSEWSCSRFDGVLERDVRVGVIAREVDSRGRSPRCATPILPARRRRAG